MNFNDISRLTQYIKIIFQLVISVKLIHGTFYFFFVPSLCNPVSFTLTAHLNWDSLYFKFLGVIYGSWLIGQVV